MKKKIICFDIDGVICETKGDDYQNSLPNKNMIEEINKLPKEEKKFAKSLFLYKYLVKVAKN